MDLKMGKIRVGPETALLLAASLLVLTPGEALAVLLAAALHEAGHLAAVALCGGKVDSVRAGAGGLEITYGGGSRSYLSDALCAAAGPGAGILAAAAASAAEKWLAAPGAGFFAGASLALSLFNLLPASVLDGGKILYAAAAPAFGPQNAEKIRRWADLSVCAALFAAGAYVFLRCSWNPAVLICAAVLANNCCKTPAGRVKSFL